MNVLVLLGIIGIVVTAAILGVRYRRSRQLGDLIAAGVCALAVVAVLTLS